MSEGLGDNSFDANDLPPVGGALNSDTTSPALTVATPSEDPGGDIRRKLDAITADLRAQRSGLTPIQKISAFLTGYGQPHTTSGWASGAAAGAANLQAQTLAQQKLDTTRQDLIAKYDLASAHYGAQNQAANQRTAEMQAAQLAKAGAPPKMNPDETTRLGLARNYFPGVSDADLVKQNRLYSPQVTRDVMNLNFVKGAGSAGQTPQSVMPVIPEITDDSQAALYPNDRFLRHVDGKVYENPKFMGGK